MKTITSLFSIFAIILLSFNCIGPQGQDGNANVGSAIYDIPASDWNGNVDGFVTTLDVPELNQDIYENGAVLVYLLKNETSKDQSFNQLPYTWLYNSITEYMDFDVYIGSIDITLRWVDNGVNNTEAPKDAYTFKVIVIEGTPLSMLKTKTDISNPDAVMAYLSANTTL
jgi:hypothetical protein